MKAKGGENIYVHGPLAMQRLSHDWLIHMYITHSPLQFSSDLYNTILNHNIKSYEWIYNANLYSIYAFHDTYFLRIYFLFLLSF